MSPSPVIRRTYGSNTRVNLNVELQVTAEKGKKKNLDQFVRMDLIPRSCVATKSSNPTTLKQAYLDVGQKHLVTCPQCGLCYDRAVDRVQHDKFHREHLRRQERRFLLRPSLDPISRWQDYLIYQMLPPFSTALLRMMRMINEEMEAVDLHDFNEVWWISKKDTVVSMIVTQSIGGLPIFKAQESSSVEGYTLEPCDEKVEHGIARMWTHPDHRGKGLCSKLLSMLNDRRLAYSQLTSQGLKVASKHSEEVLVYKLN